MQIDGNIYEKLKKKIENSENSSGIKQINNDGLDIDVIPERRTDDTKIGKVLEQFFKDKLQQFFEREEIKKQIENKSISRTNAIGLCVAEMFPDMFALATTPIVPIGWYKYVCQVFYMYGQCGLETKITRMYPTFEDKSPVLALETLEDYDKMTEFLRKRLQIALADKCMLCGESTFGRKGVCDEHIEDAEKALLNQKTN